MQYAAPEGTVLSANNANIFKTLDDLYHTSRHVLGKNTVTLEDARQLAGSVTEVRVLLTELEHVETSLDRPVAALTSISDLKQRYLELEGMVKEVRNTLQQSSQASPRVP